MNNETDRLIYSMALHETLTVEDGFSSGLATSVLRVPGGWVYRSFDKSCNIMSSVFVPLAGQL